MYISPKKKTFICMARKKNNLHFDSKDDKVCESFSCTKCSVSQPYFAVAHKTEFYWESKGFDARFDDIFQTQMCTAMCKLQNTTKIFLWRAVFPYGTDGSRGVFIAPIVVQYHQSILIRQLCRNFLARRHSWSNSVIVIRQLVAAQNTHLAHETMIMTLLKSVRTFTVGGVGIRDVAMLVIRILSKPRQLDVFLLAVLSSMGHDFIRVGANIIALETMEM